MVRQFEVTDTGKPIASAIIKGENKVHKLEDDIDKLTAQIAATRDDAERTVLETRYNTLRDDLQAAKQELKNAQNARQRARADGTYEAATGDITTGPVGVFGTDATGKLAAAAAIDKERKKDDATKNRDAIVEALKADGGGDKKEEKDS